MNKNLENSSLGNDFPRVYIVLLNWNGWQDTIECLESVFRLDYANYRVIVCDNDSTDGSLEYIKAWAENRLDVYVSLDNPLRHLSHPLVSKEISYCQYYRNEAESGGSANDLDNPLVLIQTGANLGFAGGNNVGLRYVVARNDFEYVWLLNNDTVVESNALSKLVGKADFYKANYQQIGIIGSKLMYYHAPELIQGVGGTYNKYFATSNHIGVFDQDTGQFDNEEIVQQTDYPLGASMFVSVPFIADVGLMCEDYFLYFEELDWTLRGKLKGWQFGYCWQSRVFHKEGGSIGSSSKGDQKSELSDFYGLRNRIMFTKKFFPEFLWFVRLGFVAVLFNRVRRCQFGRVVKVLSLVFYDFWKFK